MDDKKVIVVQDGSALMEEAARLLYANQPKLGEVVVVPTSREVPKSTALAEQKITIHPDGTVESSAGMNVEVVDEKPLKVIKAYTLPPDYEKRLKEIANPKCYKCKGTGVHSWKHGGLTARICKCVRMAAAEAEKHVETVADKAYEEIMKQFEEA